MHKRTKKPTRALGPPTLTRRELLAGAAVTAVAMSVPSALAKATRVIRKKQSQSSRSSDLQIRRYLAASAMLGHGRVLIVGGYDQPWTDSKAPRPLRSAVIYDPATGFAVAAAPLAIPRARHAAVALSDGSIAVVGGLGMTPTATVEIYDPATNKWRLGNSLSQPRYDHNAVTDGSVIYVLGGSGQMMLSSVEMLEPDVQNQEG